MTTELRCLFSYGQTVETRGRHKKLPSPNCRSCTGSPNIRPGDICQHFTSMTPNSRGCSPQLEPTAN